MLDSPLIRTLQLLDQEEFEALHFFVATPIFNDSVRINDTVRLFEYLRLDYPDFSSERLTKENTGRHLFRERSKPAEEVEKAMSELMHVLKQFINFRYSAVKGGKIARRSSKKEFSEKPMLLLNYTRQQLALLRFYSERLQRKGGGASARPSSGKGQKVKRAENFFQNLHAELRELLSEQKRFDHFEEYEFSDYHYFRFLTEQEKALNEHLSEQLGGDLNILAALEELDRFYLFNKLELTSRLVHYQQLIQPYGETSDEYRRLVANRDITLLIVELLRQHGYWQDSPGVALYSTLLEFLTNPDEAAADLTSDRFLEMLNRHENAVPRARLNDFKIMLRSYWNRRYRRTKDPAFLGRLHGMHREQLLKFTGNRNLPAGHLSNMLNTALKLGKTAWAEQFLMEYAGRLSDDSAKTERSRYPKYAVRTWWAMLYFTKKNIEKAAETLPDYEKYSGLEDIYAFTLAAATDVKINYELDSLDENLIRAALARIERNKELPKDRRDERVNFFKIARRLFTLKTKQQIRRNADISKELEELQAKLDKNPTVDWEWLEEKIRELE